MVALMCCFLPLFVAGPGLRADDPFPVAQNLKRPLPMDNQIPWILARASMADTYQTPLFGDWHGSDRPPLQSGLIILMQPALSWLPPAAAAFATSCAAQGLWIMGSMVLLWGLGLSGTPLKCGLVTTAITGLVLLNGIFTWPKLMSSGFLLASAGVLLRHLADGEDRPWQAGRNLALAGSLAGFSMQCHGSVAFAILPMGAFLLFKGAWRLGGPLLILRNGLAFGACFILLQVPWSIWQKLGDPPGNRLIKWHIGGVIPIDDRNAGQTILESYRNLNWETFWFNKVRNLGALFQTNLTISPWLALDHPDRSMSADFFGFFPAISWALPAWLALVFLGTYDREARRKLWEVCFKFLPALLWVLATVGVWIFLMFIPGSTFNHQGPMNLSLISLLFSGVALGVISPKVWGLAIVLQALGVLWLYYGLRYHPTMEVAWFWAMIACVATMILGAIFPKNLHQERENL
jgi:MFS family permease